MTFEKLLYAEVLSHHKSMQAAADILHITKSGLSLAIHQLEDRGRKCNARTGAQACFIGDKRLKRGRKNRRIACILCE